MYVYYENIYSLRICSTRLETFDYEYSKEKISGIAFITDCVLVFVLFVFTYLTVPLIGVTPVLSISSTGVKLPIDNGITLPI